MAATFLTTILVSIMAIVALFVFIVNGYAQIMMYDIKRVIIASALAMLSIVGTGVIMGLIIGKMS